eukprot:CAMPEP_0174746912 /NCGR_PEP_ID=MMETSP1094-20130205/90089_1 /TAXON_ID=156173 /ORGANISM="Chrysochromulina brevifilum, Strain UTEX LB 985" /LENGTH=103 /DNA_ID=CAMNT_0015951707 /DNA_START=34 /DNA_END=345 /DNA_ORIENTATION=-
MARRARKHSGLGHHPGAEARPLWHCCLRTPSSCALLPLRSRPLLEVEAQPLVGDPLDARGWPATVEGAEVDLALIGEGEEDESVACLRGHEDAIAAWDSCLGV